ncbi:MAG: heavy metal translocating P-type ATPase [Phycisphaerae bacterium]
MKAIKLSHSESQTIRLQVAGMDCPDEIEDLRRAFAGQGGILDLSFNLMRSTMTVNFDPSAADPEQFISIVQSAGLNATAVSDQAAPPESQHGSERRALGLTIVAGACTAVGLALTWVPAASFHHTTWPSAIAYSIAVAAAWWHIAPKAWRAAGRLQLDMNVLMTVAVVGAIGLGEWFEASTVAFLFMLSNWLESWSVGRARRAIQSLMELAPPTARVLKENGLEIEFDVSDVAIGDRVIVKPGEKFPLDGRVVEGKTSANQAPITGESIPVIKAIGDEVFAGTINQEGAVIIEVTKPAGDSVLAGVIRMVEQAQGKRSPSERFVDRFARYYTPAVIAGAILVCILPPLVSGGAWGTWLYRSLVLLVIACPCALVISTPVTIVSGLASAARNGVLIKGGEYLEAVGRAQVVALDKTGTLTQGSPVVEKVIPIDGTSVSHLLELASAIEQRSEHWIAQAIVAHARDEGIVSPPCDNYVAIAGKGAKAQAEGTTYLIGNHRFLEEENLCTDEVHRTMLEHEDCHHTVVALSSDEGPLGVFLLADSPRAEARQSVQGLRACGVSTIVMLTGDNEGTARAVAQECSLTDYRAELLPADKVQAIEDYKAQGSRVVMVGDGINDAPALAAAHVGIAMGGGGTDASLETADIGLMADDLRKLPWLIRHSRRTRGIIVQNVALSLGVKALFAALAVVGLANLWMAIAADAGASLVVTFNGLRLLRSNETDK